VSVTWLITFDGVVLKSKLTLGIRNTGFCILHTVKHEFFTFSVFTQSTHCLVCWSGPEYQAVTYTD